MQDGVVSVNGENADEPFVRQTESGRRTHRAVRQWPAVGSRRRPYTVPAGSYFMMGDNRTNSGDSREFGPVARRQLVGQAFVTLLAVARVGEVD